LLIDRLLHPAADQQQSLGYRLQYLGRRAARQWFSPPMANSRLFLQGIYRPRPLLHPDLCSTTMRPDALLIQYHLNTAKSQSPNSRMSVLDFLAGNHCLCAG
jgi:hypothetical protein